MSRSKLKCVLPTCIAKQFEMKLNKIAYSQFYIYQAFVSHLRRMHTTIQSIERIFLFGHDPYAAINNENNTHSAAVFRVAWGGGGVSLVNHAIVSSMEALKIVLKHLWKPLDVGPAVKI